MRGLVMSKDVMGYTASTVPEGSRVVLIVSNGPTRASTSFVAIPDVIGKSQGAALEEIAKTSLQPQVVYDYHPVNKKGTVTTTRPAGGANALAGTDALVLVSSGQPMGSRPIVELPDVIGMDEKTASETIREAGLKVQVTYEPSTTVPVGVVIDQLPNRSTYAKAGRSNRPMWPIIVGLILGLLAVAVLAFFYLGGCERLGTDALDTHEVVKMIGMVFAVGIT